MKKSSDIFRAQIKKAILSWSYLVDNKKQWEAMNRLATSPEALKAWGKLQRKKNLDDTDSVFSVAKSIGRLTLLVPLHKKSRKTKNEIQQAATKAKSYANLLASLIEENESLEFSPIDLWHEQEQIALHRIMFGLISLPDQRFPENIEKELNSDRSSPALEITTSDAYWMIKQLEDSPMALAAHLRKFAILAEKSKTYPTSTPYPKTKFASENYFAVNTCNTLGNAYGKPLFEISAALSSVVFQKSVTADQVRKWWKRKKDN